MNRLSELLIEAANNVVTEYYEENDVELTYSPKDLNKRYNFYGKFQYIVADDEIYVTMPKDTFRGFEYYLGMEYDNECIVFRMEDEKYIHLVYAESDRLLSILDID